MFTNLRNETDDNLELHALTIITTQNFENLKSQNFENLKSQNLKSQNFENLKSQKFLRSKKNHEKLKRVKILTF